MVYYILEELVMGGMVLETNSKRIQGYITEMGALSKS